MLLKESIVGKPIFEEKDASKLPEAVLCRVTYPVCNIGERNANKRVYEKEVWDKVLSDDTLHEMMDQRRLFGHAEHPAETQSDLQLTSHVIHAMWIDESSNKVYQTIDVLDTPMGRLVDSCLRANCMVGMSTRAEGDLEESEDDEGAFSRVLPESYRYITTDFTADPSTFGALPMDTKRSVVSAIATEMKNEKAEEGERSAARALLESMKCEKGSDNKCGGCGRCPALGEKCGKVKPLAEKAEYYEKDKCPDCGKQQLSAAGEEALEKHIEAEEEMGGYTYSPDRSQYTKDVCTCESKSPCAEAKAVEYSISELIEKGLLRETQEATRGSEKVLVTVNEGNVQITVDGRTTDLNGIEVASVYPDGAIHLWPAEDGFDEPVVVAPEGGEVPGGLDFPEEVPPEGEMEVELPLDVPLEDEMPPMESKVNEEAPMDLKCDACGYQFKQRWSPHPACKKCGTRGEISPDKNPPPEEETSYEAKVNEANIDQMVAQIEEITAKIEAGRGTLELQAQLEALKKEVSDAGGEVPERKVEEEVVSEASRASEQLFFIDKAMLGDDWNVLITTEGSNYASALFSFASQEEAAKAAQAVASVVGAKYVESDPRGSGPKFSRESKEDADESITSIAKELTALKIKEATERAEREVAVEAYQKLLEKLKESEIKVKMVLSRATKESKRLKEAITDESVKTEDRTKEVNALRIKLEEKAKVAHEAKEFIHRLQEQEGRATELLNEAKVAQDNKIEELQESHKKVIEQTKDKGIKEGKAKLVEEYVAYKLTELGMSIGENTRALLDECMSLREVDNILEKVTDIMRRSALHSGIVEKIHMKTPPVDPEQSKIDKDVSRAFEGM
jgi:hypothetical protein